MATRALEKHLQKLTNTQSSPHFSVRVKVKTRVKTRVTVRVGVTIMVTVRATNTKSSPEVSVTIISFTPACLKLLLSDLLLTEFE